MAVNGFELGVTVDEDQHTTRTGAETAHGDSPGRTAGNSVSSHSPAGHEQAGDLLHEDGHQGVLVTVDDSLAANYADRSGDLVTQHRNPCPGDNRSTQGIGFFYRIGIKAGCKGHHDSQKDGFLHCFNYFGCKINHNFFYNFAVRAKLFCSACQLWKIQGFWNTAAWPSPASIRRIRGKCFPSGTTPSSISAAANWR